jgi:uncharacterized protein (TIGR02444 family)
MGKFVWQMRYVAPFSPPACDGKTGTQAMKALVIYAETLYRQPGIAELCLMLQDKHGLDVNLLLFTSWYGFYYGKLSDDQMARANDLSGEWSAHVVKPLRSVRRWLNRDGDTEELLRNRVKDGELAAEYLQLNMLEQLAADTLLRGQKASADNVKDKAGTIRANLSTYISTTAAVIDDHILQPLIGAAIKAGS